MMKYMYYLTTIFLFQLSFAQQKLSKEVVFKRLNGSFQLEIYTPTNEKGWEKAGSGTANFKHFFDGTYTRSVVKTNMYGKTYNMDNTIGIDGRTGKFRLIACDKEWSSMDVYNGELKGDKLIFDNLKSDIKTITKDNKEISFRLTYTFLSISQNQLLVEWTTDNGNTWLPFVKQIQTRKIKEIPNVN